MAKVGRVSIEVLGSGCARCHKLEEVARQAVQELGIEADVRLVTDIQQIVEHGVMRTPALVVNGEVVLSGVASDKAAVTQAIRQGMAKP